MISKSPSRSATASYRTSPDGERRMASVTADSVDEAIDSLIELEVDDWRLAMVFASSRRALAEAGDQLAVHFASADVAGCTSAGIVNRQTQVGAAVQITLLGGSGFECRVVGASIEESSSREAGWAAAQALSQLGPDADSTPDSSDASHRALILLADGLVGDSNDLVRGAYEVVGASVPILGGCAGDDLAMESTFQLTSSGVTTKGVVGIALSSTAPLGLGVRHGWSPVGSPMTVTAASGTSVLGLDDRPALDVYLEVIGAEHEELTSRSLAVISQTRPLGLESKGGYHARFVRGGDLDRRALEFLVAIPEGELVTLMQGDVDSVIGAAGDAVGQALGELGQPPLGVIAFDCVACRNVIGDDQLESEIGQVASQLPPDAIVSGLYTYGEIARRGGALGFHNQTMVVLAIQ
jgi:hypothetical protein